MNIKNALLLWVPSRRGKNAGKTFPVGLLYVGKIFEEHGINVKIVDIYNFAFDGKLEDEYCLDTIVKEINQLKPEIIGFSGIATSYGWTKFLSKSIKKAFPSIIQIVGGALSSTYELLLTKTSIDYVFHGEAEANLPHFLNAIQSDRIVHETPGVSYHHNGDIHTNQMPPQIENLDEIGFPAYHLINIEDYITNARPFSKTFVEQYSDDLKYQGIYEVTNDKLKGIDSLFPIVTARGCTHRCLFCYRHMKKYRKHSIDYVIRHIRYVQQTFGVSGISFYDELFNGDVQWVFDFADAIDTHKLKIAYKTSARADKISDNMLKRLSETGCFSIAFGQESGSAKILKEYRKGIKRSKNVESTIQCRKYGIHNTVQIVIGSPSENLNTIYETIEFLKEVNVKTISINYLLPFPGAPIWKYVMEKQLINDVEEYLDKVALLGGGPIINLTGNSDKVWKNWLPLIQYKIKQHNAIIEKRYLTYLNEIAKYEIKKYLPEKVIKPLIKIKNFLNLKA